MSTTPNKPLPPPPLPSDSSVVAHVVVVGFHAQLGNRIEFAYPRLRGDPVLRSPKISDTADISADVSSPTALHGRSHPPSTAPSPQHVRQLQYLQQQQHPDAPLPPPPPPPPLSSSSSSSSSSSASAALGNLRAPSPAASPLAHAPLSPASLSPASSAHDWGVLPEEWKFLPFMALPDGVHDSTHDLVFFTLPPDVHCVSCFRQIDADSAKTHSAAPGRSYDRGVASRGSVQKSVVLLCRRPLFGVLADRLIPAVRAYFDQADFANTTVLSSLFHSLNVSMSRPSLSSLDALFHGLDLRHVVRRLGPHTLSVLKLILLERRVVLYSNPVHHASNAVIALASVFHGALDTIAPSLRPLDAGDDLSAFAHRGLPLTLFGQRDRVVLQPYAPLPLVADTVPNASPKGCLLATSHNVGLLLSSTAAAAARKAVAARKAAAAIGQRRAQSVAAARLAASPLDATRLALAMSASDPTSFSTPPPLPKSAAGAGGLPPSPMPQRDSLSSPDGERTPSSTPRVSQAYSQSTPVLQTPTRNLSTPSRPATGVPVVDALINMSNGKVSVSGALEPLCRITRAERRFMRDLMVSAGTTTSASVSASGATGAFMGSDDYIRSRLRDYLSRFLQSVSSVEGIVGGPVGGETWSAEMLDEFDLTPLDMYNDQFVSAWMTTRNAAQWARKRKICSPGVVPPPKPELDESLADDSLLPVDRVAAGLSGLRQNVAELGRFSSLVSTRAAEGLSSLFRRIEQEVSKMDTAVGVASSQSTPEQRGNAATAAATVGVKSASDGELITARKSTPR